MLPTFPTTPSAFIDGYYALRGFCYPPPPRGMDMARQLGRCTKKQYRAEVKCDSLRENVAEVRP
jgi:hypothetical protein